MEICNARTVSLRVVCSIGRGRHTPGAKARFLTGLMRPKAEALGYLEAKTLRLRDA
jgi:hypothetical protein